MKLRRMILNIFIAVLIGLFTGFIAFSFNYIINSLVSLTNIALSNFSAFYLILPLFAAAITYVLHRVYLRSNNTGIGIVQVLVELEKIKTFLMKPVSVIVHVLGAMTSLILGLSAGRFGPVVHLGAAVGSNIGHFFNVNENRIRLLIGCSSAAAIAAVFKMPFFGAVFVLEVLFKKQFYEYFSPILISSISASLLSKLLGNTGIPRIEFVYNFQLSMMNIIHYVIFGFLIGIIAILYIGSIEKSTNFFNKYKRNGIRYFIGGTLIGVISIIFPLNFEIHSNTTFNALSGEYGIALLLVIGFVKLMSTAITLGSGFLGGNFYPGITIGASLGMAYGKIVTNLTGYTDGSPLFGVLGISGMIGGYFNAPISAIVLALEFSNSFNIIMPAIITTAISVAVVYYLYEKDIFTTTYNEILAKLDF